MEGRWLSRGLTTIAAMLLMLGLTTQACLVAAAGEAGAQVETDQIVDKLQQRYASTADFSADFFQETQIKTLNRTIKSGGKVYFKRPGKMLWRYEEPKGQFVLADGKNLYLYQPEQSQVIRTDLKTAFRSDVPLSFLLGLGNLKRDFKASLKGSENNQYTLQLEAKSEMGQAGQIFLGVDAKNYDIVWVRMIDPVGNVTAVRFSQLQRGVGLKDSLFQFEAPKGAEVVDMSGQKGP